MKQMIPILLLIFLVGIYSCEQEKKKSQEVQEITDNSELLKMYNEDQAARTADNIDWKIVSKNDSLRRVRVYELLDSNKVRTSLDYYHIAMVFQHGMDTLSSAMAVKMMRKRIELDSTASKWLLAAAIDRDLMRRGEPQIYGTQYRKLMNSPWELYKTDTTKITDKQRIEYGVETLAQQREKVKMMNKKKLSELQSNGKSISEIVEFCKNEDVQECDYDILESGINIFGYQLMAEERLEDALAIFKLNTELYPKGYNTYDSYGECLLRLGDKEGAIKAYEKSVELKPSHKNGKRILIELKDKNK